MLKLAEQLALAGLKVTFLNYNHNHDRLVRFSNVFPRFVKYPGFEFRTIPDVGQPDVQSKSRDIKKVHGDFKEIYDEMIVKTKPTLRDLLVDTASSVDCKIGDGVLGFVLDIGEELDIPVIHFNTISADSFWVYFVIHDLIEAGELAIPIRSDNRFAFHS